MYNNKLILSNGSHIYPCYMDSDNRQKMKNEYQNVQNFMRCGCRPDANLYYGISEELRIYPLHHNYKHDKYCCRFRDESGNTERQTAYVVSEDDGEVVAYTSFNPLNFDVNEAEEIEEQNNVLPEEQPENVEEIIVGKEDATTVKEKKEPKLSLSGLIRSINIDCFTEKVLNNQKVTSPGKFAAYVYYRMKKVRLFRTKRYIGDLSLEKDGCRFVYMPYVRLEQKEENGALKCHIITRLPDGTECKNFVYPETMVKVAKKFGKTYGMEPDEHTMLAGFQYAMKTISKRPYKVLGRIHLFQVSDIGIYCRSMTEVAAFNSLQRIAEQNKNIRYWIPPEDPEVGAIVEVDGKDKKILVLFKSKKSEQVTYDSTMYVPFVVDSETLITEELLYDILSASTK